MPRKGKRSVVTANHDETIESIQASKISYYSDSADTEEELEFNLPAQEYIEIEDTIVDDFHFYASKNDFIPDEKISLESFKPSKILGETQKKNSETKKRKKSSQPEQISLAKSKDNLENDEKQPQEIIFDSISTPQDIFEKNTPTLTPENNFLNQYHFNVQKLDAFASEDLRPRYSSSLANPINNPEIAIHFNYDTFETSVVKNIKNVTYALPSSAQKYPELLEYLQQQKKNAKPRVKGKTKINLASTEDRYAKRPKDMTVVATMASCYFLENKKTDRNTVDNVSSTVKIKSIPASKLTVKTPVVNSIATADPLTHSDRILKNLAKFAPQQKNDIAKGDLNKSQKNPPQKPIIIDCSDDEVAQNQPQQKRQKTLKSVSTAQPSGNLPNAFVPNANQPSLMPFESIRLVVPSSHSLMHGFFSAYTHIIEHVHPTFGHPIGAFSLKDYKNLVKKYYHALNIQELQKLYDILHQIKKDPSNPLTFDNPNIKVPVEYICNQLIVEQNHSMILSTIKLLLSTELKKIELSISKIKLTESEEQVEKLRQCLKNMF